MVLYVLIMYLDYIYLFIYIRVPGIKMERMMVSLLLYDHTITPPLGVSLTQVSSVPTHIFIYYLPPSGSIINYLNKMN